MANGTIAFDTLTTSDSKNTNTEKSIDTSYIFNGVVKWFATHRGDFSNAVEDSFNVASHTDTGTGGVTYSFTNNMGNTNYAGVVVGKQDGAGNNNCIAGTTRTSNDTPTLAASLEIIGTDPDAGVGRDYEFVNATSMGDLA